MDVGDTCRDPSSWSLGVFLSRSSGRQVDVAVEGIVLVVVSVVVVVVVGGGGHGAVVSQR